MKKGKVWLIFALAAAVCLLLCACNGGSGGGTPASDTSEEQLEEAATDTSTESVDETVSVVPVEPSYPVTLPNGITVIGGTAGVDGQNCENLFDGDDSTVWCVDMDANDRAYVEWRLPAPVEIHNFYRRTSSDSGSNPQVWKVLGSENGVDWFTCLDTGETEETTVPNGHYGVHIIFHTPEGEGITLNGQYFRFEVERTEGSSLLQLREIGVTSEE